jgi:thiol:disulfide interchange protein
MRSRLLFLFVFLFALISKNNAQELHAHWKQEVKKVSDCEYDLIFKVTIDPTWHMYSQKSAGEEGPNPTAITFKKSADYELIGKTKESKPVEENDKVFEMKVFYFVGKAEFTQRIKLKTDKKISIGGKYEYQVCTDEKCEFPPAEKFSFDLPAGTSACLSAALTETVVPTTTSTIANTPSVTAADCKCDTDAIVKLKSVAPPAGTTTSVAPATTAASASTAGTSGTGAETDGPCSPLENFFLGLGAGFAGMLMPCIYSLIPLTVSFFLKRSKSRPAAIRDSMLYGFFIVISFVIPTMLITIAFGPTALSKIATNTYVNLFFFLLFVVFALSFFGLFEIGLPSSWANKLDAKADKGGVIGIFFMALTLVVVSFSCTAGLLGNLLAVLAKGESYMCPLAGFTGFGLGIALPFMFFAFFPSLLKSLPKSGGWMTTFKVTIAFIELALAVKFLANADNVNEWGLITREVFLALWIGIFAMLSFYLLGVFRTSHDEPPTHLSVGRILWATFFVSFTLYMIPGLWGAPLNVISAFPPPHNYAESPDGVGYHGHGGSVLTANSSSEISALEEKMITGPAPGLRVFKDDYESALKYSGLVKKPLFVDFTGKACVNCRLMESSVWISKEVLPMLKDSVVIVSLYVDSNVDLPETEKKDVMWYGKMRTLETIGDKYGYLELSKYNSSSQPLYVLLNQDESTASNGTIGTEKDEKKFAAWLRDGIQKFHASKK